MQTKKINAFEGTMDTDTEQAIKSLEPIQEFHHSKIESVRTVLVVLSAGAMPFDCDALKNRILSVYPEAAVFFQSTIGKPVGKAAPKRVDLLIDFTGPGQKQNPLAALGLKSRARVLIGRNAGFFRKKIYHRVFDEKPLVKSGKLPTDLFSKERICQMEVLKLCGVTFVHTADTTRDLSHEIALSLSHFKGA